MARNTYFLLASSPVPNTTLLSMEQGCNQIQVLSYNQGAPGDLRWVSRSTATHLTPAATTCVITTCSIDPDTNMSNNRKFQSASPALLLIHYTEVTQNILY